MEGGREGGREGGMEGGREEGRKEGREGEGKVVHSPTHGGTLSLYHKSKRLIEITAEITKLAIMCTQLIVDLLIIKNNRSHCCTFYWLYKSNRRLMTLRAFSI